MVVDYQSCQLDWVGYQVSTKWGSGPGAERRSKKQPRRLHAKQGIDLLHDRLTPSIALRPSSLDRFQRLSPTDQPTKRYLMGYGLCSRLSFGSLGCRENLSASLRRFPRQPNLAGHANRSKQLRWVLNNFTAKHPTFRFLSPLSSHTH